MSLVFRTCLYLQFLLISPAAFAMPWAVDDEETAISLREALDALWPDHNIEVVVGELDDEMAGLRSSGDEVTWVQPRRVMTRTVAEDPWIAVVAVRAWIRTFEMPSTSAEADAAALLRAAEAAKAKAEAKAEVKALEEALAAEQAKAAAAAAAKPETNSEVTGLAPSVWEVGAGIVQHLRSDGSIDSVQLAFGRRHRGFTFATHLVAPVVPSDRLSTLDTVMLNSFQAASGDIEDAYAAYPIYRDGVEWGLHVDWDFGITRQQRKLAVGPMVMAGLELHRWTHRQAFDAEHTEVVDSGWDFGPTSGVGAFVATKPLAVCLYANGAMRTYSGKVTFDARLTLDLRFRIQSATR